MAVMLSKFDFIISMRIQFDFFFDYNLDYATYGLRIYS